MRTVRIGLDLVSERSGPGGIHTYTNRLIEAMAGAIEAGAAGTDGFEIAALANDDYEWLFPVGAHPSLRIVTTGRRGLGALRRRLLQETLVPRLVRRAGLDLVHSVNNVLPAALGAPGVVTVHDLSPFVLPRRFGFWKRAYLRWAVPRAVRRARRVIAVSASTRADILRWIPAARAEKIAVVAEAADPRFRPEREPEAEEKLRARLKLPGEFLLSVGAAEAGKNLRGVAAALEILRAREGLAPAWILAGASGQDGRRLLESFARLAIAPQVRSLGVVPADDLPRLYRLATVFVFPSLHEGFGLPALEALASGTPTVASNRSSLPEVVGRAALTVNPEKPAALARAIGRLWRRARLREALAARGPKQAARFSWDEAARKTIQIYREALQD